MADSKPLIIGEFEIFLRELLGHGTFCAVFKGRNKKSGETVAAKRYTDSDSIEKVQREAQLMKHLNHVNIIKLHALLEESSEQPIYWSIMELCEQNLEEYMKTIALDETADERVDIMCQFSAGLSYLHNSDPPVIHRDIKPSNILLNTSLNAAPIAKIADFDLAKEVNDVPDDENMLGGMVATICGTPYFMAPEQVMMGSYGLPADVYATAITLYYTLTGSYLTYNHQGCGMAMALLVATDQPMPVFVNIVATDSMKEKLVKEVIEAMLRYDPGDRPRIEQVLERLRNIQRGINCASGTYDRLPNDTDLWWKGWVAEAGIACDGTGSKGLGDVAECKKLSPDDDAVTASTTSPEPIDRATAQGATGGGDDYVVMPNSASEDDGDCARGGSHGIREQVLESGSHKESILDRVKKIFRIRPKQVVQMLARQKGDDLTTLYIDCVKKKNVEKVLKSLHENGFTEGPMPSKQCFVYDGETINIKFTGNITAADDFTETITFHSSVNQCMQEVFIQSIRGPGVANRGYLLFSAMSTGKELCKLPIKLNKGQDEVDDSCRSESTGQQLWDKRFMFAIKCVLSCPIALKKWKELAGKLTMHDAAEKFAAQHQDHSPHEPCQRVLELWYQQKTDKVQALQHLKVVLQEIGAKNAHEGIILMEETRLGSSAVSRTQDERQFHKALKIVLSSPVALRSWKMIGRELGLPESILTEIEHRTVCSLQSACSAMLEEWHCRMGRQQTTTDCLIQAMVANDITNVAESLLDLLEL